MNQENKILNIIIAGLMTIAIILGITTMVQKNETLVLKNDALKFKEEYEKLNNTIRESDGAKYNNVEIPEENPIKYISALEAVDIIKNGNGIIYFGANWCPWCRNAVEVLIDTAKENNLETIYYVDMDHVRNIWEIQDNKLVKTQEEKEGYYELLNALDSILRNKTYTLKDKNGKEYDTSEKRIGMPLVISIKDGNITSNHTGTVSLKENQTKYSKLEPDQTEELTNIYQKMITSIK